MIFKSMKADVVSKGVLGGLVGGFGENFLGGKLD